MHKTAVLLHNIRSSHNVGSIFRTSDAAGVSAIYISGYSPTPLDKFKRPQKEIAKTALGAEQTIPWKYYKSPMLLVRRLKAEGWRIVGIEQDARSRDYRYFKVNGPTLYILGNEVRGMSAQMRALCDDILEIPMHGKKESLNVSVTAGIVLFQTRE